MYGGKFAFQNRLGKLTAGREFIVFALFYFVFEGNFAPGGFIFGGAISRRVFCVTSLGGLYSEGLNGEAYFRNFTVSLEYCALISELKRRIPKTDCFCGFTDITI